MDGLLQQLGGGGDLAASFAEFARRPEHRALLEEQQREEVAAALALREAEATAAFLAAVRDALDAADQRLLAPVLRSPTLRAFLVAMAGADSGGSGASGPGPASGPGSLRAWLSNPRVLELLREAARALRNGAITEAALCELLARQARPAAGEAAGPQQQPPRPAPHQVQLPARLLVDALNEHMAERRAGNAAYEQRDWPRAQAHYERALGVVNFVVGASAADDAEVAACRAAVLLNMAALALATGEAGTAVRRCDEALAAHAAGRRAAGLGGGGAAAPEQGDAFAAKAYLRRAKANLTRHEYASALADCDAAAAADPWSEEVPALRAVAARAQTAARTGDRELAARMLRLGRR